MRLAVDLTGLDTQNLEISAYFGVVIEFVAKHAVTVSGSRDFLAHTDTTKLVLSSSESVEFRGSTRINSIRPKRV